MPTPAGRWRDGDLFYSRARPGPDRRVVIVDRSGAERDVAVPRAPGSRRSVSQDGRRLALGRWEGARRTIWTLALDTGALTQVTYLDDTFSPRGCPTANDSCFRNFRSTPTSVKRVCGRC